MKMLNQMNRGNKGGEEDLVRMILGSGWLDKGAHIKREIGFSGSGGKSRGDAGRLSPFYSTGFRGDHQFRPSTPKTCCSSALVLFKFCSAFIAASFCLRHFHL